MSESHIRSETDQINEKKRKYWREQKRKYRAKLKHIKDTIQHAWSDSSKQQDETPQQQREIDVEEAKRMIRDEIFREWWLEQKGKTEDLETTPKIPCPIIREILNDIELRRKMKFEIAQHLNTCDSCARYYAQTKQLEVITFHDEREGSPSFRCPQCGRKVSERGQICNNCLYGAVKSEQREVQQTTNFNESIEGETETHHINQLSEEQLKERLNESEDES